MFFQFVGQRVGNTPSLLLEFVASEALEDKGVLVYELLLHVLPGGIAGWVVVSLKLILSLLLDILELHLKGPDIIQELLLLLHDVFSELDV